MVMLSESQGSPLRCLQFPTMAVTENIVSKKLRIKIGSKKVEAGPGTESCESGLRLFTNDECSHNISVNGNKSVIEHKFLLHSSDDPELCAAHSLKVKLPMRGSNKCGPPELVDDQKKKRLKMDRCVKQRCGSILKTLMTHRLGWVFSKPVDPVALGIPDYFSIISHPMDLGTIKRKLENNMYSVVEEFAADVRLTFSNAIQYNPPFNDVHQTAKELDDIFNRRWKSLMEKRNCESINFEQGHILSGRAKNTPDTRKICQEKSSVGVSLLPKMSMSSEEKKRPREELLEASRGRLKGSLDARASKAEPAKMKQNGGRPLVKVVHKGTANGNRSACGSAHNKTPLSLVASKCCSYATVTCHGSLPTANAHASSSDLSSERSLGPDCGASKTDCEVKCGLTSRTSKSDPDSDGAVSAVDEENIYFCRQLSTPATTAASGEGWTPLMDIQLSPKKALRAAMLRSRFADTILKAKQKTLRDHGDKADPVKLQQEKERLERQQLEEKARIEAQIIAAEAASRLRAETELKMQRERERRAARIALQKMEKTVEIDDNLEILKDLELLSGCSPSDLLLGSEDGSEGVLGAIESRYFGNPLERLGLFIKEDYMVGNEYEDEEAILNGGGEEGEIFS